MTKNANLLEYLKVLSIVRKGPHKSKKRLAPVTNLSFSILVLDNGAKSGWLFSSHLSPYNFDNLRPTIAFVIPHVCALVDVYQELLRWW